MLENLESLWALCVAKQKFDAVLVASLKRAPDLKVALKKFWIKNKFQDDDLELYNWFIGSTFNVCINELK